MTTQAHEWKILTALQSYRRFPDEASPLRVPAEATVHFYRSFWKLRGTLKSVRDNHVAYSAVKNVRIGPPAAFPKARLRFGPLLCQSPAVCLLLRVACESRPRWP